MGFCETTRSRCGEPSSRMLVYVPGSCFWICGRGKVYSGEGNCFISSRFALSLQYVSPTLWSAISYTSTFSVLLLVLLFSQHTCRPGRKGRLLPLGQLSEAVLTPSVCPAKQAALLLQCGQSLGSSL